MTATMIEKYGQAKVRRVISDLYGRILGSSRLSHYFDGVDIHTLVAHQSAFLEAVMGGPHSHSPEQISRLHARLGITAEDFEEVIELLGRSLDRFDVDTDDRLAVQERYKTYADQVISADSS